MRLTNSLTVPVYDARYVPDFQLKNYLENLASLPKHVGEIEEYATVVVSFNPVVYLDSVRDIRNINMYILWAIILDSE